MRSRTISVVVVAGLTAVAHSQVVSRLIYEVSLDGSSWRSNLTALPGETIQVRTRVQYIGTSPTAGLSQIIYQPVISGWNSTQPHGQAGFDSLVVQSHGTVTDSIGPFGGTRSTPIGSVTDSSGLYGRIAPFAGVETRSTSYYRGFVGVGDNAGLLRISQAHITNWIGVGPTSGTNSINNVSGRGGIVSAQIPSAFRISTDPPYAPGLDVVVFKFGFTLGDSGASRTMQINTPRAGLGRRATNGVITFVESSWYATDTSGVIDGDIETVGASVHVIPSFGSTGVLLIAASVFGARRRRANRRFEQMC